MRTPGRFPRRAPAALVISLLFAGGSAAPARAGTDLTCDRRIQASSCTEFKNLSSADYSQATKECTSDAERKAGRPTTSACPMSRVVALCEGPYGEPSGDPASQRTRYYSDGGSPFDEEALVGAEYECRQSGGRWTKLGGAGSASRGSGNDAYNPSGDTGGEEEAGPDPSKLKSCACNKMSSEYTCTDYPKVFSGGCSLIREKCLSPSEDNASPGKFSAKACPKSTIHATCANREYLEGEPVRSVERFYSVAGSTWSTPDGLGQAKDACESASGTWQP